MYSDAIISQRIDKLERAYSLKLQRYDHLRGAGRIESLNALWNADENRLRRPLRAEESAFIRNELLMSKCDFRYWLDYARIQISGGGLGIPRLWGSQQIVMQYITKLEEESWDAAARGWPVKGIRILYHKARQLGASALARLLVMHRACFTMHMNALAASVDDKQVKELYDRDKRIYDNLPWWMRPTTKFDEKAAHIQFGELDTMILYQHSRQKSGLGQGRQFPIAHLTECASWEDRTYMIALDFIPTIPVDSPHTLIVFESTAQGRGNWWHEYTEETRRGEHPEWTYIFVPWYASGLFRTHAPDSWSPSQLTLAHAAKVRETSPQWFFGRTIELDRDQLYWYETERASAQKAGELNFFLSNRCATPEESFQHSTVASFSPELLDRLRLTASAPKLYFEVSNEATAPTVA